MIKIMDNSSLDVKKLSIFALFAFMESMVIIIFSFGLCKLHQKKKNLIVEIKLVTKENFLNLKTFKDQNASKESPYDVIEDGSL